MLCKSAFVPTKHKLRQEIESLRKRLRQNEDLLRASAVKAEDIIALQGRIAPAGCVPLRLLNLQFRLSGISSVLILASVSDVTHVLEAIEQGDLKAADQLLPLVYTELRRLAAHKMANETAKHTLQATALVHEAWLKLVGDADRKYRGRDHFFAAAAEAMRRILIDNARRKLAQRHGGGQQRLDVMEIEIPAELPEDEILLMNDALEKLAGLDRQKAELVKLRFFVGLTLEEAAEILGLSVPTSKRYWAFARAWLYNEIETSRRG